MNDKIAEPMIDDLDASGNAPDALATLKEYFLKVSNTHSMKIKGIGRYETTVVGEGEYEKHLKDTGGKYRFPRKARREMAREALRNA